MPLHIPQANPRANYLAYSEEIDCAIADVLRSGSYILGQQVATFEREFAEYLGGSYVVGVANGTDALHLSLRACGIEPGDMVITAANTATATVAAIELAGATPLLADVDATSFTLDASRLDEDLRHTTGLRLKAIIAVHLYGHPADMISISRIARKLGIYVLEDCAQAHGASIGGRKLGTWGDIAAFSFYPTKNLGALGDAGAIATNNSQLADHVRQMREYGWRKRYVSEVVGMNSRLDELQAAVLRVKLRHLDRDNLQRCQIAARYERLLGATGVILPPTRIGAVHVYHQYVIRTPRRDQLKYFLNEQAVETSIHYPVPVHRQPAYAGRIQKLGALGVTEQIVQQILSLPMFPELSEPEVERVARLIATFLR